MAVFPARRLLAAAVAGAVGVVLLGAVPAHAAAAAKLTASTLAASVSGHEVTATTTIKSSLTTVVPTIGVCVRDSAEANFDFVEVKNTSVGTGGYSYSQKQTFPSGTYNYWSCAYYNGTWLTLNSAKQFVITDVAPPGPVVDSSTFPQGDLPGWKQVFKDDFTTNAAAGTFSSVYKSKWTGYDGFSDTSKAGTYNDDILSVNNGLLDMYLHKLAGRPQVAAPMPIVTAPWVGQTYGKFSVRFKSDALAGYKTAWLLWPDSNNWSEGEIDFPEGGLDSTMWGFNHCVGNPSQNCAWADTKTTFTNWHTMSIEWTPSRVSFILDGRTVGNDTKNIPTKPMHWILQTESTGGSVAQDGHLQIDWVSVYTYSPSTTGAAVAGSTPVSTTTTNGVKIATASAWQRLS